MPGLSAYFINTRLYIIHAPASQFHAASPKSEDDYDRLLKMLLLGDSEVGKSSILHRFVSNEFRSEMRSTMGVEFSSKLTGIKTDKRTVRTKLQVWDYPGKEGHR